MSRPPAVSFVTSAAAPAQFPRDGMPEVAFLGRSNVGKSSLINALTGVKNLARVSSSPGRTRLVNFFKVASEFYLVDLPGYGFARVPEAVRLSWDQLVRSYLEGRPQLALAVFLVDVRHEPQPADLMLYAYLDAVSLPYVVAATKADKLGRSELARRRQALRTGLFRAAADIVPVSAHTREGVDALWRKVREAALAHRAQLAGKETREDRP